MTRAGCVLGIDTSCYTTSCAAIRLDSQMLASVRLPLEVTSGNRGLRQSEAVFQHVRRLPEAVKLAMKGAGQLPVLALCASASPTGRVGSYMPVFTSGLAFARGIAEVLRVTCFETSHQQGHFAAARIGLAGLPAALLGMHLSGGTTEVVRMEEDSLQALGGSDDISAGQLIDRVGVALGLLFPAGPELEKLARTALPSGRYPAVVKEGIRCSFSGAEAQAMRDREAGLPAAEIAAEVFDCVARTALKIGEAAEKNTGLHDLLITGGVASSALLREMLISRAGRRRLTLRLFFGQAQYAGDNAAGVAAIGLTAFNQSVKGGLAWRLF